MRNFKIELLAITNDSDDSEEDLKKWFKIHRESWLNATNIVLTEVEIKEV
jgi:hypothetical protein